MDVINFKMRHLQRVSSAILDPLNASSIGERRCRVHYFYGSASSPTFSLNLKLAHHLALIRRRRQLTRETNILSIHKV